MPTKDEKSDRSHVVLWAKELPSAIVFLRPLGLRLLGFFKDELMRKHLSRMFSCDQERKKRDQRRSDTVVIFMSINDADQGWGVIFLKTRGANLPRILGAISGFSDNALPRTLWEIIESSGSGGSMVARLKLKEIDGRIHQPWSLRLNSTQHGKTH